MNRLPVLFLSTSILGGIGFLFSDFDNDEISRKTDTSLNALPSLKVANSTSVVSIPKLLSENEIEVLLQSIAQLSPSCGKTGRDASGTQLLDNAPWKTIYLHTNQAYKTNKPLETIVKKVISNAIRVASMPTFSPSSPSYYSIPGSNALSSKNESENGTISHPPLFSYLSSLAFDPESLGVRCVEYHEVQEKGGLPSPKHFDGGSIITIDVMLSDPTHDFTGGTFTTHKIPDERKKKKSNKTEKNNHIKGKCRSMEQYEKLDKKNDNQNQHQTKEEEEDEDDDGEEDWCPQQFEKGDVIVFLSHKYHFVQPVRSGLRRVMVIELWQGENRTCAHRCDKHWGHCYHNRFVNVIERLVMSSSIDS